jgi:hypothetical protein
MPPRLLRTVAVSITVTVCWTIVWHAGDAEAAETVETTETASTSTRCITATGRSTSVAVCVAPQGRGPEYKNERL